jgi:DNA repair protein RadC
MPKRHERLYQVRFDEHFRLTTPQDVTPEGFTGLEFRRPNRVSPPADRIGRFVREVKEPVYIHSPGDAAAHLLTRVYVPFSDFDQEELWVLLLDNKLKITHEAMVYRGTVNTVSIREAELLKEAVRLNSPAMVLSHCHPSGDPNPSPQDVQVTILVNEAAKLLGIELVDHIVVGKDTWVSLKQRGLGF